MGGGPLHWALGGHSTGHWGAILSTGHWGASSHRGLTLSFSCPQPSSMLPTHLVSGNRPRGGGMVEV